MEYWIRRFFLLAWRFILRFYVLSAMITAALAYLACGIYSFVVAVVQPYKFYIKTGERIQRDFLFLLSDSSCLETEYINLDSDGKLLCRRDFFEITEFRNFDALINSLLEINLFVAWILSAIVFFIIIKIL